MPSWGNACSGSIQRRSKHLRHTRCSDLLRWQSMSTRLPLPKLRPARRTFTALRILQAGFKVRALHRAATRSFSEPGDVAGGDPKLATSCQHISCKIRPRRSKVPLRGAERNIDSSQKPCSPHFHYARTSQLRVRRAASSRISVTLESSFAYPFMACSCEMGIATLALLAWRFSAVRSQGYQLPRRPDGTPQIKLRKMWR